MRFESCLERKDGWSSFVLANANVMNVDSLGSAEEKETFVTKVVCRLKDAAASGDSSLSVILLDVLRICFREKTSVEAATSSASLGLYLRLLERGVLDRCPDLAEMALRCITNGTYKDISAAVTFVSPPVLGLEFVARVCIASTTHPTVLTRQLALRLFFMLASQEDAMRESLCSNESQLSYVSVRGILTAPPILGRLVLQLSWASEENDIDSDSSDQVAKVKSMALGSGSRAQVFIEGCKLLHFIDALPLLVSRSQTALHKVVELDTPLAQDQECAQVQRVTLEKALSLAVRVEAALHFGLEKEISEGDGSFGSIDKDKCPRTPFALQLLMTLPDSNFHPRPIPSSTNVDGDGDGDGDGNGNRDGGDESLINVVPFLLALLHGTLLSFDATAGIASLEERAFALTPLLAVSSRLVSAAEPTMRKALHRIVFPQILPLSLQTAPTHNIDVTGRDAMAPANPGPPRSLRRLLLACLTCLEPSVARLSAELVWELCDGDRDAFVESAGMGYAAGLLSLKGLL